MGNSAVDYTFVHIKPVAYIIMPMYSCSRDWWEGMLPIFFIKSCLSARIVAPVGGGASASESNVPTRAFAISMVTVGILMFLLLKVASTNN